MKVNLDDLALVDLANGWRYYENRSLGWGDYFKEALNFEIAIRLPRVFAVKPFVRGKIQKMATQRFPWAVYFTVNDGVILVIAVLDCRFDPNEIDLILKSRN